MLSGSALVSALGTAVVSRPKTGLWYRATPLAHAEDPLGRGRPIGWMRFNEENGARVLYLGETPQICMDEVDAIGYPAPFLLQFPLEIKLAAVLDLTDPKTCGALQIKSTDIRINFRPVNPGALTDMQALGEACSTSGQVDGILYASVAATGQGGNCLAVIERNLRSGTSHVLVRMPQPRGLVPTRPPPTLASYPPTPAGAPAIWDLLPFP